MSLEGEGGAGGGAQLFILLSNKLAGQTLDGHYEVTRDIYIKQGTLSSH